MASAALVEQPRAHADVTVGVSLVEPGIGVDLGFDEGVLLRFQVGEKGCLGPSICEPVVDLPASTAFIISHSLDNSRLRLRDIFSEGVSRFTMARFSCYARGRRAQCARRIHWFSPSIGQVSH